MNKIGKHSARFMPRILSLLFLMCLLLSQMMGQETITKGKHEYAFFTGYGHSHGLNVSYAHKMTSFQLQYQCPLRHPNWQVVFQPKLNFFSYTNNDSLSIWKSGYEYGISFNLMWRSTRMDRSTRFYIQAGVGPHYLSRDLSRQAGGFIICSTISVGYTVPINQRLYLDIQPGFRHISNAEIKLPNGGINNLIWSIGLRW